MEDSPEDLNNDNNNIFYNDNYMNNYEEMACCNTALITTFFQENTQNVLNFLNDFCNNIQIDDQAQIINDPKQIIKTPLCSNNKQSSHSNVSETNNGNNINNNSIDNFINNNEINNNIHNNRNNGHSLNNSQVSEVVNPSNDSAAEPIMDTKKYENMVLNSINRKKNNLHRRRTNLFNVLKDVFKDFFTESNEVEQNENNNNIANSHMNLNLNLKKRPILKRIIDNEIKTPLNHYQDQIPQRPQNIDNVLSHANSQVFRRPQLFSDNIMSFNISEENDDESVTKLVSIIPVFTVKEKNKNNNNKCAICLSDFEVGEKKSTLPCVHSFHCSCIERWIKKKNSCPICKLDISVETFKRSIY